ncbi:hypothetical protein WG66_001455 [Moniliophthora roreri]|nr:hypothetical protein WG66_001455 [Moniliophthora roreri]
MLSSVHLQQKLSYCNSLTALERAILWNQYATLKYNVRTGKSRPSKSRVHSARDFKCQTCDETFARESDLRDHEKIHLSWEELKREEFERDYGVSC